MKIRSAAIIALLGTSVALGAVGLGGCSSESPRGVADKVTPGSHLFVIVLENQEFERIVGNPGLPFINRLARRGALAVRYFAITHPSLPNYLAIIGGATFEIHSDCTACSARGSNLAVQLDRAGVSWRAYMDDMPRPCYAGGYAASYAKKHNPFAYFPSITDDPDRCANVVPGSRLHRDLRGGRLPDFSWITPNLCNDGHDCGIAWADGYLEKVVPKLLPQLGAHGFLVLTFDEGVSDRGCCRVAHGGRIATIIVGPDVVRGARLKHAFDHYSLLRTLEDFFSLSHLRGAGEARSMRSAFRQFPPPP
jgi:phosphatidylinositol-3-phosphatase